MKEFIGQTIKDVLPSTYNDEWLFLFEDNTYCCVRARLGYERGDVELETTEFYYTSYSKFKLDKLGIMSIKEIDSIEKKADDERKKRIEKQELNTYERLKAKFEK